MSRLIFRVLSEDSGKIVGRLTIPSSQLVQLGSDDLRGFFAVVSPSGKKIGEMQITCRYRSTSADCTDSQASPDPVEHQASATDPTNFHNGPKPKSSRTASSHIPSKSEGLMKRFNAIRSEAEALLRSAPAMPLRTPADVNVTAAEDSAGHSADFLSKLLAQGEKLRDEMAVSAYVTENYTTAENIAATDAAADPHYGAEGDIHSFVAFAEDDDAFKVFPDFAAGLIGGDLDGARDPITSETEAGWILDALDASNDHILEDDVLIEDLFYRDSGDSDSDCAMPDVLKLKSQISRKDLATSVHSGEFDTSAATDSKCPLIQQSKALLLTFGVLRLSRGLVDECNAVDEGSGQICELIVEYSIPGGTGVGRTVLPAPESAEARFDHSKSFALTGKELFEWADKKWDFWLLLRSGNAAPRRVGTASLPLARLAATAAWANVFELQFIDDESESAGTLQIRVDLCNKPPSAANDDTSRQPLTLDLTLFVEKARGIPRRSNGCKRNVYAVCRCLGPDDETQSQIQWEMEEPVFRHQHSMPVVNSLELMAQLKKGAAVVELWDKSSSVHGEDELIGYAQVPLHSFYLALHDPAVMISVLRGDNPTVACETYVDVCNPLHANAAGEVLIFVALGTEQQVKQWLHRTVMPAPVVMRGPEPELMSVIGAATSTLRHHTFEVYIKRAANLRCFSGKQTACFVQFQFPESLAGPSINKNIECSRAKRQPHRTPAVLSEPDARFDARSVHTISLSSSISIVDELVTLLGDGLALDVWERYEYPTAKDRLAAQTVLPWSEIREMIVKHHAAATAHTAGIYRPVSAVKQAWALPVGAMGTSDPSGDGTLHVEIVYRPTDADVDISAHNDAPGTICTLLRAAGLGTAVSAVNAPRNMSLASDMGILCYVKYALVHVDLAPGQKFPGPTSARRRSPWLTSVTGPRSFCPEFHETKTLHGDGNMVAVHVWHRRTPSVLDGVGRSPLQQNDLAHVQDVLIAQGLVPCPVFPESFLGGGRHSHRGWHLLFQPHAAQPAGIDEAADYVAVGIPARDGVSSAKESPIGAIEMEISNSSTSELLPEALLQAQGTVNVQIVIRSASMPVDFLTHTGYRDSGLLIRYQIAGACIESKCVYPETDSVSAPTHMECKFRHSSTHSVSLGSSEFRFFCTRQLELRLIATSATGNECYIGSAFVDVGSQLLQPAETRRMDTYWVINSGHTAMPTAHVTAGMMWTTKDTIVPNPVETELQEQSLPPEPDSMELVITVDRAVHLPMLCETSEAGKQTCKPNAYVSYQIRGEGDVVCTDTISSSRQPCWGHRHSVALPKSFDFGEPFVFKVWHNQARGHAHNQSEVLASGDKLIGFATVDMRPLRQGFAEVSGWYHLFDARSSRQGQLKIRIAPPTVAKRSSSHAFKSSGAEMHRNAAQNGITVPIPPSTSGTRMRPSQNVSDATSQLHQSLEELELCTSRLLGRSSEGSTVDSARPFQASSAQALIRALARSEVNNHHIDSTLCESPPVSSADPSDIAVDQTQESLQKIVNTHAQPANTALDETMVVVLNDSDDQTSNADAPRDLLSTSFPPFPTDFDVEEMFSSDDTQSTYTLQSGEAGDDILASIQQEADNEPPIVPDDGEDTYTLGGDERDSTSDTDVESGSIDGRHENDESRVPSVHIPRSHDQRSVPTGVTASENMQAGTSIAPPIQSTSRTFDVESADFLAAWGGAGADGAAEDERCSSSRGLEHAIFGFQDMKDAMKSVQEELRRATEKLSHPPASRSELLQPGLDFNFGADMERVRSIFRHGGSGDSGHSLKDPRTTCA